MNTTPSACIPSATAIDAIRPPIDFPLTKTGLVAARSRATRKAARQASRSVAAGSGAFRPCSLYGKLNRSVPRPASLRQSVNPVRSGAFRSFPAPCATTTTARAAGGKTHRPVTGPLFVSTCRRSSSAIRVPPGAACQNRCRDGNPLPRDLRLRLRGVEERLLPGGAEGPRDAVVFRRTVPVGGDQLHVPPAPVGEDARGMGGTDAGGVPVHAEGAPEHHAPA